MFLLIVVLISQKTAEGFGRGHGGFRHVGGYGRRYGYAGDVSVNINQSDDYPWLRFLNFIRL